MPDQRRHRGPHPEDCRLFGVQNASGLREATADLSWLLTRGYAFNSSLKIVGDRYALDARQRIAMGRCACGDGDWARRQQHQVQEKDLEDRELWIDGYNVLTSVESALSHGVILHARDGCYRDMASMHGTYRRVEETLPAIQLVGELLADCHVQHCRWFLDQPVSNSGRLKAMIQGVAVRHAWNWSTNVVPDPDSVLYGSDRIVATADSRILNQVASWFNLARLVIDRRIPNAWIVDLSA